ncbi:MAG: SCP2 sterol-binding domain-containing protein, partial [Solirubrobacterales bacterium]|nr:SCP2 sterol-binding domain-containing protein [Solirubrobacterales bacterium]
MTSADRHSQDASGTALSRLIARFDPSVFEVGRPLVRIRVEDGERHDVVIEHGEPRLEPPRGDPDAILSADPNTWSEIAQDVRGGMAAFRRGHLRIRRDLHLGVGFLAATALSPAAEGRLRIRHLDTAAG